MADFRSSQGQTLHCTAHFFMDRVKGLGLASGLGLAHGRHCIVFCISLWFMVGLGVRF